MDKKNNKNDYATKNDDSKLKDRMDRLDASLSNIERDLKEIKTHMATKADMEKMNATLVRIETKLDSIAAKEKMAKIKREAESKMSRPYQWVAGTVITCTGVIIASTVGAALAALVIVTQMLPK